MTESREGVREFTLYCFGDSVLDCAAYTDGRTTPGGLLVRNNDELFPEFRGWDLSSRRPARLEHRAVDGSTSDDLAAQLRGLRVEGPGVALVSVGGNDLLHALLGDEVFDVAGFKAKLEEFARRLPVRPVLFATVYDPSFGDDSYNLMDLLIEATREMHRECNAAIAEVAARHGRLVDLHAHFLGGERSWLTRYIEPSLIGASEVRRAFLPFVLEAEEESWGRGW